MTDSLSYLYGLEFFGIKFGLENMRAIAERLGHPEQAFRSVHIAGTNGKGSVTAMVDAGLRAAGHHSARYTSPHLLDITERFSIDGRPVTIDALRHAVDDVRAVIEALLSKGVLQAQPTFFEVTTTVAFELFRRAYVDIGVVEVGLGGRLDATNILTPILTAITSIAFDHEQYLGSTLDAIAAEKGGIIKPGVPVIVGRLPAEARATIESLAREREAVVVDASVGVERIGVHRLDSSGRTIVHLRTARDDYGEIRLGLRGMHQIDNAIVAVRILEWLDSHGLRISSDAIRAGLEEPSWPGRLELRRLSNGREVLLDAAHNPAGAGALASYLHQQSATRLPLVFAAMRDKDVDGMFEALLPAIGQLVLTRATNRRSADPHVLAEHARRIAPELPVVIAESPAEALEVAWNMASRIVVAGSIFLLGDVMEHLGGS